MHAPKAMIFLYTSVFTFVSLKGKFFGGGGASEQKVGASTSADSMCPRALSQLSGLLGAADVLKASRVFYTRYDSVKRMFLQRYRGVAL